MAAFLIPRPSSLTREAYVAAYGGVFECSPWVAEAVWPLVADGALDAPESLGAAMRAAVAAAGEDRQLALLRAHPDLAGKAALAGALTEDSRREQAGAGLDSCSAEELAEFHALNSAYTDKFGFPFIIAVRGLTRYDILAAFRARLPNSAAEEMATALAQVGRIAQLRLNDKTEGSSAA